MTASKTESAWAEGIGIFAGAALLTVGIFQFLEGIAAAAKDEVFVNTPSYVFKLDLTTWGWIHFVFGLVAFATGIGLFLGKTWARALGLFIALCGTLLNFMFLPYYPWWAITVITLNVVVMWAIATQVQDV
jgi:hypothetical protein